MKKTLFHKVSIVMLVMLVSIFLYLFSLSGGEKESDLTIPAQKAIFEVAKKADESVTDEEFEKAYLEFVLEAEHQSACP